MNATAVTIREHVERDAVLRAHPPVIRTRYFIPPAATGGLGDEDPVPNPKSPIPRTISPGKGDSPIFADTKIGTVPRAPSPESRAPTRRGMVLLVVLVVVSILSLAALTFSKMMTTEHEAADLAGRQIQARELANSGAEASATFLIRDPQAQLDQGSWYDNPSVFQGVIVVDNSSPHKRGRFTVLSPKQEYGYTSGVRYGLEDESGRLNLNALLQLGQSSGSSGSTSSTSSGTSGSASSNTSSSTSSSTGSSGAGTAGTSSSGSTQTSSQSSQNVARQMLMGLPGMNEQIADAILDWIDTDDQPREFGAEVESYSGLDPPYAPKNGPLDSIEELLLVRGVTPSLLFGQDANRNGVVDSSEASRLAIAEVDNSDGSMNGGWAAYLTLKSSESQLRPDGTEKIDLNQSDLSTLSEQLKEVFEENWVNFIIAYRQNGPYSGNEQGTDSLSGALDLTAQGGTQINSVLDLIGVKAQATLEGAGQQGGQQQGGQQQGGQQQGGQQQGGQQGQQNGPVLNSPFTDNTSEMASYLPELLENTKTTDYVGRININQAPKAVLNCIPGITPDVVDQILGRRQQDPVSAQSDPSLAVEAWPLVNGIVNLDQMKKLMPYVTARGSVYRAQVVGFFDQGGPAARIEVTIDATQAPAAIVSWKEMTNLGRGYTMEVLGSE